MAVVAGVRIVRNRAYRAHARASEGVVVVCALVVCAIAMLAVIAPVEAATTGTTSQKKLFGISIPASARVHGTTATSATPAPAATTPATTTPATTTPASGAQPGTVAPATPKTAVPPTTTPTVAVPTTTNPAGSPAVRSVIAAKARTGAGHTRLSTGALVLAVLGALLALGCIVWVLARWLALEPRWTVSLMHSLREASYRGSATWAEFSDWARLGR
jgi:hypothetical protein